MSQTVSRWGRSEVALTSDQEWENHLQEAELAGVFVSPSGQQVAVDGFCVPVLLWANQAGDPGQALTEDQAVLLARYMVARWAAFPVLWILPGDSNYGDQKAPRWHRIGSTVSGHARHAPVALHCCGTHLPTEEFHDEKWCAVLGYQSGHGDTD